jgi:hypothetical protein
MVVVGGYGEIVTPLGTHVSAQLVGKPLRGNEALPSTGIRMTDVAFMSCVIAPGLLCGVAKVIELGRGYVEHQCVIYY